MASWRPLIAWAGIAAPIALAPAAQTGVARLGPELTPNVAERWPCDVRFSGRAGALAVWAIDGGFVAAGLAGADCATALRFDFEGVAAVVPSAATSADGVRHFVIGREPRRWAAGVPAASSIAWREAWPGVDVVLCAGDAGFEYRLELDAGADASAARVRCAGHRSLAIDERGALAILTDTGVVRQSPPAAWEVGSDGEARAVECRFRVLDDATFGFDLGRRDRALAAVVDPALIWSTYISGEYDQAVEAVARGPLDAAVIAGWTASLDFPTTLGAFDPSFNGGAEGFVSRIAADGTQLVWSTVIGGASDDFVRALAIDALGRATIAGDTASSDFPATAGAHDATLGGTLDGFVARLAADGASLEYATFVGGSAPDAALGVAVDVNGSALAAGRTRGQGFPVTSSAYDSTYNGGAFAGDAFALRLAPDGSQVEWGTYFGGAQNELASRIALAPGGDVVVSGSAYAGGLPIGASAPDATFQGASEAFVARFDALGATLRFATYLGGSEDDEVRALAVRPTGETICAGVTTSADFPLAAAFDAGFDGASEGFVSEISAAGDQLARSTFFGGSADDSVAGIALDPSGLIVLCGDTASPDLATTPGAFQRWLSGWPFGSERDLFVARAWGDLSGLEYSTFFGSPNEDRAAGVALDTLGHALIGGNTGGPNFPTTPGALQGSYNVTALREGVAARLAFLLHPISYGTAKVNSQGTAATLWWRGFPSVADADFAVRIDSACGSAWTAVFSGMRPASSPFVGGRLLVRPPLKRYPRFKTDVFGYGEREIPLPPWLAGQTIYFQAWYEDLGDPHGASLSDALRVIVYP